MSSEIGYKVCVMNKEMELLCIFWVVVESSSFCDVVVWLGIFL